VRRAVRLLDLDRCHTEPRHHVVAAVRVGLIGARAVIVPVVVAVATT